MRLHSWASGAGALILLSLTACDVTGAAPPPDPAAISLQPGDLPGDFQRCPNAGEISGYLRYLAGTNAAAREELAAAWRDLQRGGASGAAVTVYAEQRVACAARLGAGVGRSVATVVVRFPNEAAALAAYRHGMLGFSTPSEDEEVPGMARGAATGIGRNAWVLERSVGGRSLIVGLWQRHLVAVLFIAVDADPLHAKQAIAAVDGRIP